MFSHAIRHLSDTAPGALPYDAEVEYLESSTTGQYIDTGITFDRLYDFEVEVNCCPVVATRSVICGTYNGSGTSFNLEFGGSDNGIERQPRGYVEIGGGALDNRATAVSLNVLASISLSYRASDRLMTLKSGSDTITGTVTSGSGTSSNTLWLFNDHRSGGMNRQVRISSIKVKKDGEIVRDMIAVRVGGEYCLYDKANPTGGTNNDGLYHNAGSGAFSGGSDKAKAQLPYDAEVEYLDVINYTTSSNVYVNQFIRTGVIFDTNTSVELDIKGCFASDVTGVPDGCTANISGFGIGLIGYFDGTRKDLSFQVSPDSWGSIRMYGNTLQNQYKSDERLLLKYDAATKKASWSAVAGSGTHGSGGTSGSTTFTISDTGSYSEMVLFSAYGTTINKAGSGCGRFFNLRIWQGDTLVRDFIPVRVGTEYCLYDKANPTGGDNGDGLYHNKGTGAFKGSVDKPSAGTKFLVSRTMGTSLGKIKPVLKHYDIATSYLINECTGARPTKTNAVFPSGKYAALDYTPIAYQHYDAEVEYLECSGTQWVDTQWYPGKDAAYGSCYYQIDFMQPSTFTGSPEMEVWGCWGGGANWNCWANKNEASLTVVSGSRAANTRVVMGRALGGASSKPIGLFAWQGLAHPCNGVRIYSYQVRRSSATGVLLQDFIPVRVGTAGYFYDRVSGKLFGTGNLAVGPDTGGGKGAKRFIGWGTAPYYDSEVNYVECTGTQYLDTGLYIDPTKQHIKSTCRIQFIGTGRQLMGWNVNDNCYWGVANGGTNYEVGGTTTTTTSTTMPKTGGVDTLVWEHFTNANQTLTLKGSTDTVISRAKAAGLPGEYYILQLAGSFIGKMYGYTIEIDDQLVRDYVPVRCGTIGMLYDRITNQLWASSSTDPFIPGTDVSASTVLPTNRSLTPSDNLIYDIPMVHAQWQSPTTVTFDATANGGQMPSGWTAPDYYEGQPYGTLPQPTKSGEVFLGWFTSGGTRITESSIVETGTLTARYAVVTWGTSYSCTTTSSYKKTGIYSANRYSSSDPIVVDWGDGTSDVVYGNISQLAHTYSSVGTFTVKISDNISTFCPSYSNSTWYRTTSQNQYTFKQVLTLSSKVAQLTAYAFYYCSAMTDAIIPSGATSIPNYCFYYCSQLKSSSVQLPSTVTSVGAHAFDYCTSSNFNSITIPGACTSIGSYAFECCYYLRPVFESGSATLTLNTYSFSYCGYSGSAFTIDLSPRKITSIPNYCFYYCRYLNGITWPQGLTSIGGSAFRYCFYYSASTGTVEIPEGVTSISGTYAFANCLYLTAVTLPSTLTNLNNYTFYYCTRLQTIVANRSTAPTVSAATFGNGTTYYTGRTYYSTGKNSLYVPAGATGYNASYWSRVLCNNSMCGFTLIENSVQEVEYITLTTAPGTSSNNDGNILPIDVVPGTSTELEIDWVVNNSTGSVLFGASSSSDSADFRIFSTNSNYYYDRGSGRLSPSYTTFGVGLGTRFTIKAGNYYLQNVTGGYTATGTSAAYTPQSPQCLGFWGYTTIYSCKVWNGNTLVRNLTPARIGQNGGLYDSVSGRFFRVIGNGAYTLGSDVTQ